MSLFALLLSFSPYLLCRCSLSLISLDLPASLSLFSIILFYHIFFSLPCFPFAVLLFFTPPPNLLCLPPLPLLFPCTLIALACHVAQSMPNPSLVNLNYRRRTQMQIFCCRCCLSGLAKLYQLHIPTIYMPDAAYIRCLHEAPKEKSQCVAGGVARGGREGQVKGKATYP